MYFFGRSRNLRIDRFQPAQLQSGQVKRDSSRPTQTYHNQTNYASFKHHKDFKAPDTYNIFLSNANQPIGDKLGTMKLLYSETNGNEVESTFVPDFLGAKKDNINILIKANRPDLGYIDGHADLSKRFKVNNDENKIYHTVSQLNFKCNIKDHPHEIAFKGKANQDSVCSSGAFASLNPDGTPDGACNF